MASRLNLQTELEEILGSDEVYFQPPESISMSYPAITYKKQSGEKRNADNLPYFFMNQYQIVVMDYDPDATWVDKFLERFKYIRVERQYISGNLNHWSFSIYY